MVREPNLHGIADAWRIELTQEAVDNHIKEFGYVHTSLRQWIVRGPYHPMWNWWYIGLVSLKDFPGVPPANKLYSKAEYEYCCYSLQGVPNIEAIDKGDTDNRGFETFLTPPDVQFHFDGVTDEQAIEICDAAIHAIVSGQSCDSDFRGWWEGMLANTVQHYKEGKH